MKVLSSTHAIAFANQDFATQFFAELVVFLLKCGLQNLFGFVLSYFGEVGLNSKIKY